MARVSLSIEICLCGCYSRGQFGLVREHLKEFYRQTALLLRIIVDEHKHNNNNKCDEQTITLTRILIKCILYSWKCERVSDFLLFLFPLQILREKIMHENRCPSY